MNWIRRGVILTPNHNIEWLNSWAGASCALIENETNGKIFIYVTGRDTKGRGRIGLVEFNIIKNKICKIYRRSVLKLGEIGSFDENGTTYPCVLKEKGVYKMYFTGWILGVHVGWYNGVGLAIGKIKNSFNKFSKAPIIHRDNENYIGFGSSFVHKKKNIYNIYTTRFESWKKLKTGKLIHYYNIKEGTSKDGVHWNNFSVEPLISFKNKLEYAISKPCIFQYKNRLFMWYSYRGSSYRIGFAYLNSKGKWIRADKVLGLKPLSGWESDMVCYPYVFKYRNYLYMLYNGNGYGKTGLGLAEILLTDFEKIIINLK
jgi:hypothetical protein